MIPIDKGIPLPPQRKWSTSGGVSSYKYPFKDMKVGDSFLETEADSNAIGQAISRAKMSLPGTKFVSQKRNQTTHNETGIRVWRSE